jgi:hypothetical protein
LLFLEVSLCFSLFEALLLEALLSLPDAAVSSELSDLLEDALLSFLLDGVEALDSEGVLWWLEAVAAGFAVEFTDAAGDACPLVFGTGVPIGVEEAFEVGLAFAVGLAAAVGDAEALGDALGLMEGAGEVDAAGVALALVEAAEPV